MPPKTNARLIEIDRQTGAVLFGVVCLCFGLRELTSAASYHSIISKLEFFEVMAKSLFENDGHPSPALQSLRTLLVIKTVYSVLLIYTGSRCFYKKTLPRWELIMCLVGSIISACIQIDRNSLVMAPGYLIIALIFATVLFVKRNSYWALVTCLVASLIRASVRYNHMSFDVSSGYLIVSLLFAAAAVFFERSLNGSQAIQTGEKIAVESSSLADSIEASN